MAKGEDTLWNISFVLFHETQFNAYFITLSLISWHSYKICKKVSCTNHHKKKNAILPCLPCLHVVDIGWPVSHEKVIFTGECFFTDYFTWDKNGFVHYQIQVILINKQFENWCTLQDIQMFDRTSQSTRQFIDSYLLTIKKKSVIFSGSKQIPKRNTMLCPRKYVNIYKNT